MEEILTKCEKDVLKDNAPVNLESGKSTGVLKTSCKSSGKIVIEKEYLTSSDTCMADRTMRRGHCPWDQVLPHFVIYTVLDFSKTGKTD